MKTPGYRIPYYAKKLNVPSKTIERWIRQLRKVGKIKYTGATKTGGYSIKDKKNYP